MKKWLVTGTLLMIVALLAGCISWWGNCNAQQGSGHRPEGTICTDRYVYQFDETVHIRFTVTNISKERLVLKPSEGGSAMDINVERGYPDSVEIWWSGGQELGPEWMQLELNPGESRTIEWEMILPERGLYWVSGCWPNTTGFVTRTRVKINYKAPP